MVTLLGQLRRVRRKDPRHLVMDYAPNGTLRTRHPKGTVLPVPTVVSYVKEVAQALQYAHERKIVHRDVKLENMLIGEQNQLLVLKARRPEPSKRSEQSGLCGRHAGLVFSWPDFSGLCIWVDPAMMLNGKASAYLKARVSQPAGYGALMQGFQGVEYRDKRLRLSALVKAQEVEQWAVILCEKNLPQKAF
jgi:serine/threonine protein kinase